MSACIPIIKLTQRRQDAKNFGIFNYGRTTGHDMNGLDQDRYIDVGQIRSIDNSRVLGLVGVLEEEYWDLIRAALNIVLEFS
jgi:hypothetical protein